MAPCPRHPPLPTTELEPTAGEAEGLALEAEEQRLLLGSKNQIEAVMSTLEKRDANYLDPE